MDRILALLPTIISLFGLVSKYPKVFEAVGNVVDAVQPLLPAKPKYDVKWLQTTLNGLGYDTGAVDGIYGDKTKAAVSAYQTAKGLVVDGWAGISTTAALVAEKK